MTLRSGAGFEYQDREVERQDREREQRDREIQRAQAERDRESSLYEQGNNAIYEGRWDRAVTYFTRLADLKGTRADSALYWKSYAQNRLG
jgi:outer membrane protein assembly factor BamD (BamD/ComL family)